MLFKAMGDLLSAQSYFEKAPKISRRNKAKTIHIPKLCGEFPANAIGHTTKMVIPLPKPDFYHSCGFLSALQLR